MKKIKDEIKNLQNSFKKLKKDFKKFEKEFKKTQPKQLYDEKEIHCRCGKLITETIITNEIQAITESNVERHYCPHCTGFLWQIITRTK